MYRPTYETAEDIERELRVGNLLRDVWGAQLIKTPKRYPVDFVAMERGAARGWVEVKNRNNPSTQYGTLRISVAKIISGVQLSAITGLPFFLVAAWTDGVFFRQIEDGRFPIVVNGRVDRGDAQDIEPLAEIPVSSFQRIG